MMMFEYLPEAVQKTLRAQFVAESRKEFDRLIYEHLDYFLELPEVKALWYQYREACWEIERENAEETWIDWLATKDLETRGEP